jgi:CspA family cold shock protein
MSQNSASSSTERFTGRVKWFNNKAGYGFITITDGLKANTDVFVHHSAVTVDSEQYKYLVQGEYVEFNLSDSNTGNHPFQAATVGGINNGKLMCETRRELRSTRSNFNNNVQDGENNTPVPNNTTVPNNYRNKQRGQGPREGKPELREGVKGSKEEGQWTYVTKTKPALETKIPRNRGRPPKSVSSVSV